MPAKITTNWMWLDEASSAVMGAVVDTDRQTIQWFNEPGCACGDSQDTQAIRDFLASGPKWIVPPDDILSDIRSNLIRLLENTG